MVWELHRCLMIQNLKDSRVDQNNCYMLTKPVKVILFWCSLSPRETKFIMLGGLKTIMEVITKYCFFDNMEIRGSSYFQRRMIEVL